MDSLEILERDGPVITTAMIEAGAAFYRRSLLGSDPCDGGAELVADVFLAMHEAQEPQQ